MIKDTNAQPGEEALRARSRGVPSAGASIPVELGCATLPHMDVFPNLDALQTSYFRDFYGGSSRRHDPLLTQSPAPSPSPEDGGRAESSRLLITPGLSCD